MTNIDNFKTFVKQNPTLITHVKNGTMSWQKFYEIYDLYGEEENVWKEYLTNDKREEKTTSTSNTTSTSGMFSNIIDMAKNLDTDKIQDGITSIQKVISLLGDMLSKETTDTNNTYTPRPIYRRFDD